MNTPFSINDSYKEYDATGMQFFMHKKQFSNLLFEKWCENKSIQNKNVTININENVSHKINSYSLGDSLSTSAVCRIFSSIQNIENCNILWYITDIETEERIIYKNNQYLWQEGSRNYTYGRHYAIIKLNHFFNDFAYVNDICNENNSILYWYTDCSRITDTLNTKFLHKHYLNNNSFYKGNKLIDLKNMSINERHEYIAKCWLKRCSS